MNIKSCEPPSDFEMRGIVTPLANLHLDPPSGAMELHGSMVSPLVTEPVPVKGYAKLAQDAEDEELGGAQKSDAKRHAEKRSQASVLLENDLKAAIEVKYSAVVTVIYPHVKHTFQIIDTTEMQVSLRDDPSISGTCQVASSFLRVSESFGSFGLEVAEFLKKEQLEVDRERELQQKRKDFLNKEIDKERWIYGKVKCNQVLFLAFCGLLFSGLLVACVFAQPQDSASALSLSLVVTVLFCCTVFFCVGVLFLECTSGLPLVWILLCSLCLVAAAVRCIRAGFWWGALMPGFTCCCGMTFICSLCLPGKHIKSKSLDAHLSEFVSRIAQQSAAERTIVFHGSVLPGSGPCVASWPGKYESAWDSLVQGSRKGHVSAAVVFLPEGSEHFGHHDPIPEAENLEGSCWCVPLYGEEKPWGCRWWTKWMENIEKAVAEGATLEVYYFKGMVGKGKVNHFLTAGKEHLRREAISSQKKDFMKSQGFLAVKSDLEHLQKEPRGDSTSQYSREVQRLFLASLSEEDRSFMEASEGLGNSQKAEVAWLEKQGFAYTEVDVSSWLND